MPDPFPAPDIADVDMIDVLRALGDPVRMDILGSLIDGAPHPKAQCTGELTVEKSTLSHHFRVLREAGLTRTIVSGRTHTIQLRKAELDRRFPGLLDAVLPAAVGR